MRRLFGVIAALAVAISVWTCLPFSRTFITSPPIVGVYRAETGEPLSGVQIAIARVWMAACVLHSKTMPR